MDMKHGQVREGNVSILIDSFSFRRIIEERRSKEVHLISSENGH